MNKIYYIDLDREKRNTAGAKAPDDIAELCRRGGYHRISMPLYPRDKSKLIQKIWLLTVCTCNWWRIMHCVEEDSIIIYQHPQYGVRIAEKMIPMVQRKRNCKFVTVVHDLESLRGGIEGVIKNNSRTNKLADSILLRHIPTYGIRTCAKVRDNKEELTRTAQELVIINLVMSIVSYAVFVIALIFVPRLRAERTLYAIVSLTIIFNVMGMEWLYKALEQYTYITIRSIVFKFIALVAMFAFVHQKADYVVYGAITLIAASGSSVFNLINTHKFIGMRPVGKYHFKRHFKPIVVFFAMSCATTVYTHLDTVMLGFMKTDADVGYYNAAVKIKTILVSIVTSLGVVLLPRASYYIEHKMVDEFYRIAHKAINFVFLIALPMMLYFMIFAKEGILFLSGDAYENAVLPMQIIMPTIIFIGLTNVMGIQILVPLGREKIVLYSEIAGAVADLIANFILIPRFASVGAAIGTLIAEIVVWIVQFCALKNEIAPAYSRIQYPQMVVALAIGCAASVWVKILGWNAFFTLLLSAILFFGSYGLVLILTHEPLVIEIVNQIFGKVKKFISL